MNRTLALALSALTIAASLGLAETPASAHVGGGHFGGGGHFNGGHFGRGGDFGRRGFGREGFGRIGFGGEQSDCVVQQQVVEGFDGPFIRNVTICD
jgi:hypothetical protein